MGKKNKSKDNVIENHVVEENTIANEDGSTTETNSKNSKKHKSEDSIDLTVLEVEKDAVIVNAFGWRRRVYFDKTFSKKLSEGEVISVEYTGNKDDVHSMKFKKLK